MAMTKTQRKQRLRKLEKQIQQGYEAFVQTGNALLEIQEDELYLEHVDSNGEPIYPGWSKYLGQHVVQDFGIEQTQAKNLIRVAKIRPKLPSKPGGGDWGQREILAFKDLAPVSDDDRPRYDFKAIDKADVKEAITEAVEIAEEPEKITSSVIRQAVDKVLGIDRRKEAAKAKAERERQKQIDLDDYLRRIKGTSEGWLSVLEGVPDDAWEDYASEIDEAATALESLAKFLRT